MLDYVRVINFIIIIFVLNLGHTALNKSRVNAL